MLNDTITVVAGEDTYYFDRLQPGKWLARDSSLSEPHTLEVKSSIDATGKKPSRYTVQFSKVRDVTGTPSGSGLGTTSPTEDRFSVYVVLTGSARTTQQSDFEGLWQELQHLMAQTGVFTKILRGES